MVGVAVRAALASISNELLSDIVRPQFSYFLTLRFLRLSAARLFAARFAAVCLGMLTRCDVAGG
jgi:hypothetical protein